MTITPQDEPGVLMEATWDGNGDIDRESFLGEVVNGKQKIVEISAQARQVAIACAWFAHGADRRAGCSST